jgi:hypothetical protein
MLRLNTCWHDTSCIEHVTFDTWHVRHTHLSITRHDGDSGKKTGFFLSQRLACFFSKNRTLKPFFHFNCINGLCIGPDKYAVRFFCWTVRSGSDYTGSDKFGACPKHHPLTVGCESSVPWFVNPWWIFVWRSSIRAVNCSHPYPSFAIHFLLPCLEKKQYPYPVRSFNPFSLPPFALISDESAQLSRTNMSVSILCLHSKS